MEFHAPKLEVSYSEFKLQCEKRHLYLDKLPKWCEHYNKTLLDENTLLTICFHIYHVFYDNGIVWKQRHWLLATKILNDKLIELGCKDTNMKYIPLIDLYRMENKKESNISMRVKQEILRRFSFNINAYDARGTYDTFRANHKPRCIFLTN